MLGGGELLAPTEFADTVGRTSDGGVTWELTNWPPFPGSIYGLSYDNGNDTTTVVVTGPSGTAWTPDEGDTWESLPGLAGYWAVDFANPKAGWLVGTEGRILKISF